MSQPRVWRGMTFSLCPAGILKCLTGNTSPCPAPAFHRAANLASGARLEFDVALCCFQWLHGGEDSGRRSGKYRCDIIHKNQKNHQRLTRAAETSPSDGGDARKRPKRRPSGTGENFVVISAKRTRCGFFFLPPSICDRTVALKSL